MHRNRRMVKLVVFRVLFVSVGVVLLVAAITAASKPIGKNGGKVGIAKASPTPIIKGLKPKTADVADEGNSIPKISNEKLFSISYRLPSGWATKKENKTWELNKSVKYNQLTFTKGDYEVKVGYPLTGVSPCVNSGDLTFTQIYNNHFGTLVKRANPAKLILSDKNGKKFFHPYVCSNYHNTKSEAVSETPVGAIAFKMPEKYDPKMLEEMDTIVSRIRF